ncbi:MAG: hypothetical protein XD63_0482 [Thermoanaerobacterales bacterium 50_218]|nr:MAG: hypothetical protein XD63_0482 [Thermoanaerobacterales bacterium 50_218]
MPLAVVMQNSRELPEVSFWMVIALKRSFFEDSLFDLLVYGFIKE